jgi:hypothetical protein
MKDHGSGAYQVMLNQQDPSTGKYSRVAVEKIQIINPKYPPVVPDGDWVEDKANEMWKWGANAVPTSTNGPSYPPGFNMADMMDKADARALKMVEIMTPKAPPPKDDTVLTTLLTKLLDKSLTPPPPPDTSGNDRLLQMLMDDRKADRAKMDRLEERLNTAPPQKNIVEQFMELKPAIAELVPLFGGRAGKTDWVAEVVKDGMAQLPDLIELGRDMLKRPEPATTQANGNGNGTQKRRIIAPPTPTTATEPVAKPIDKMTEEEKRKHIDHLWSKWGSHLLSISSKLVEEFKVQDQGYSFRDWYQVMW